MLVTVRSFDGAGVDLGEPLRAAGLVAVQGDPGHDLDALRPVLAGTVAWIAGGGPITAAHLALARDLRIVARYGVGVEAVDQQALAAAGVTLTNTPGANAESVADLTVGLLLAAARQVVTGDRLVRKGRWPVLPGRELGALAVGVVGFGHIGRAVARRLRLGFGCRVVVHDPFLPDAVIAEQGCEPADLDTLLREADVLTLHAPPAGGPLIDRRALSLLRTGAILVNTARGELLDEALVAEALREGRLGAVAVDVLRSEGHPARSPLVGAPNCIVTPHCGAQTVEAHERMGHEAVAEVLRFLRGRPVRHPVAIRAG